MADFDQTLPNKAVIRHFEMTSQILQKTSRGRFEASRPHTAYIPAEALAGKNVPTIYILASWLGAGRSMFQWEPFREDLGRRLARLMDSGIIAPCVVVCPDLYVDYGGSQYVNSDWIGGHADHILHELIPHVESHFPVLKGAKHRGVLGRSSGGYGALRLAMDSNAFAAVACHAGDMGFDWVYRRTLIDICVGLAKFQDPVIYLQELKKQKKLSGFDTHILMMLGMCAFYSPNVNNPVGFDLPISIKDGAILEDVWQRWLAHDPIVMIEQMRTQERLGALKCLFIDCGNRDQYFLQFGARQFTKKLKTFGIPHIYQEFEDNHSGTSYRYDESLPKIVEAIS